MIELSGNLITALYDSPNMDPASEEILGDYGHGTHCRLVRI
jgi:hypothetical protein